MLGQSALGVPFKSGHGTPRTTTTNVSDVRGGRKASKSSHVHRCARNSACGRLHGISSGLPQFLLISFSLFAALLAEFARPRVSFSPTSGSFSSLQ